jgi:ribosomal protein L16/L10AE
MVNIITKETTQRMQVINVKWDILVHLKVEIKESTRRFINSVTLQFHKKKAVSEKQVESCERILTGYFTNLSKDEIAKYPNVNLLKFAGVI